MARSTENFAERAAKAQHAMRHFVRRPRVAQAIARPKLRRLRSVIPSRHAKPFVASKRGQQDHAFSNRPKTPGDRPLGRLRSFFSSPSLQRTKTLKTNEVAANQSIKADVLAAHSPSQATNANYVSTQSGDFAGHAPVAITFFPTLASTKNPTPSTSQSRTASSTRATSPTQATSPVAVASPSTTPARTAQTSIGKRVPTPRSFNQAARDAYDRHENTVSEFDPFVGCGLPARDPDPALERIRKILDSGVDLRPNSQSSPPATSSRTPQQEPPAPDVPPPPVPTPSNPTPNARFRPPITPKP